MRRRVEALVPADVRDREIKLGTGGLRDVEFAQLLQLVHGRTDESLHVSSTLEALAALGSGGYVGRDDAANLTASYEFLRLLEHRLQLQRLKRTHMLPAPDDEEALRWLARAAHMRPDGTHDALGVLREELKRQNLRVSRLHAKLFYQPLLESVGPSVGFATGLTPAAAERQLAALGYEGPQTALTHLSALVNLNGRRGGCSRCCCRGCWTGCRTPRPGQRLAGLPPDQRGDGRPAVVSEHPARRERGGQAAHARAGHIGLRPGTADARTGGDPAVRRRTDRTQAARRRPGRGGPRTGRLVRPVIPEPVRAIAAARTCGAANWPGSPRPTCSACSR